MLKLDSHRAWELRHWHSVVVYLTPAEVTNGMCQFFKYRIPILAWHNISDVEGQPSPADVTVEIYV